MHINIKIYTLAHIYAYAILPHRRREISITLKILTECLGGFRLHHRKFYGWVELWKLLGKNDRIKYDGVEYGNVSFFVQRKWSENAEESHCLEDYHLSQESNQMKHSVDGQIGIKAYAFQNSSKRNLNKRNAHEIWPLL